MAQVLSLRERAARWLVDPLAIWERFLHTPEGTKWVLAMVRELTPATVRIRRLGDDLLAVRQSVLHADQGHVYFPTGRVQLNGERREYSHYSAVAAQKRKLEAIDQARSDVEQLAGADPVPGVDELEAALQAIRERVDAVDHLVVELEGLVWLSGDQLEMMMRG